MKFFALFPSGLLPGATALLLLSPAHSPAKQGPGEDPSIVRVFLFAGQSNMVGSDSKARDVSRFPRYLGLDKAQPGIRFSYCIGRQNKMRSDGCP